MNQLLVNIFESQLVWWKMNTRLVYHPMRWSAYHLIPSRDRLSGGRNLEWSLWKRFNIMSARHCVNCWRDIANMFNMDTHVLAMYWACIVFDWGVEKWSTFWSPKTYTINIPIPPQIPRHPLNTIWKDLRLEDGKAVAALFWKIWISSIRTSPSPLGLSRKKFCSLRYTEIHCCYRRTI